MFWYLVVYFYSISNFFSANINVVIEESIPEQLKYVNVKPFLEKNFRKKASVFFSLQFFQKNNVVSENDLEL